MRDKAWNYLHIFLINTQFSISFIKIIKCRQMETLCYESNIILQMQSGGASHRKLALNQYLDSKDKSRFVALAQKLSQHLNNLDEDKNCRIRWLWELIQNAKDAPNEFGKCKIKMEITESSFIFSHNGDPFKVSDVESLVTQYSSKAEENKSNTETTGKYGTGFITTYILSRIVTIKGLLVVTDPECLKKPEAQFSFPENYEDNLSSISSNFQEDSLLEEDQIIQRRLRSLETHDRSCLYQEFKLHLDRQYRDRDTELYFKLMRTEREFMDNLQENEPKPKWVRNQGDISTYFIYENLDEEAYKMIKDALACLKELFPYALLFNPKLSSIRVVDRRKGNKIKNFQIKSIGKEIYNDVNVFNVEFNEQGKAKKQIISLAYLQDENSLSTIAMPVKFAEGAMNLLEVNHKYPKMFKEFPLIGCKDHGFNFVFTSRRFYPNESRSDLLLHSIQGRENLKSRTNWESIKVIFEKGLHLYKKISEVIACGQENLLILRLSNSFCEPQYQQHKIKEFLQIFQQQILALDFIQFKNRRRGRLTQLVFPQGSSEPRNFQNFNFSFQLNSIFAQIIGEQVTLDEEWYARMYLKLTKYKQVWSPHYESWTIRNCLSLIGRHTLDSIKALPTVGTNENALKLLQRMYEFLHKYAPSYVTQDKRAVDSANSLNYVLTNSLKFKNLKDQYGIPLKIKDNVSKGHEEILAKLDQDVNKYTVYDPFSKYFINTTKMNNQFIMHLYEKVFYIKSNEPFLGSELSYFIKLGRFLATFNIKSDMFELFQSLNNLEELQTPFLVTDEAFVARLAPARQKEFKYLFQLKGLRLLELILQESGTLSTLVTHTHLATKDEAISWLNKIYQFQKNFYQKAGNSVEYAKMKQFINVLAENKVVKSNLSMSEIFTNYQKLAYFSLSHGVNQNYKGHYPNESDVHFYEKMRTLHNSVNKDEIDKYYRQITKKIKKQFALKDLIEHEQSDYLSKKKTTFSNKYKFIVTMYLEGGNERKLDAAEKLMILDYIYELRQAAMNNPEVAFKLQVFEPIEKTAFIVYPSLNNNCISNFNQQIFMHHLLRHPEEISAAIDLAAEEGSLGRALVKLKQLKE